MVDSGLKLQIFDSLGHRTRSDDREQPHGFEQFAFSERLSELGLHVDTLRRSMRDSNFPPFTELHATTLKPMTMPDASAFSALAGPGEYLPV